MKVRILAILVVIIAGIAVAVAAPNNDSSQLEEYNSLLVSARANAENDVPYTACLKYLQAFKIKCDDESIYREYLKQAELVDDTFYSTAVKNYVSYFPKSQAAYEVLCKYYYDIGSYHTVIDIAKQANEAGAANNNVKEYFYECYYMYKYIKKGLEECTSFLGNYAMIKEDGKYGYITQNGSYLLTPTYDDANVFLGNTTAVYDGSEWYFINTAGYKIAKPKQTVENLSFLNNNKIRVATKDGYGYTGSNFDLSGAFPYEYASNYKNGIAAVKKDGKWALIDANEKAITGFIYDDIKLDEYETCIGNGVIFAKKDGKYKMLAADGSLISNASFDDVYPFVSNEPAAVCIDGKWGFVDASGAIVIDPQYDNAKSFSSSIAPVQIEESWGYISKGNEVRIKAQFEDCLPFTSNGVAAVKEDGDWNYIKLLEYYYNYS